MDTNNIISQLLLRNNEGKLENLNDISAHGKAFGLAFLFKVIEPQNGRIQDICDFIERCGKKDIFPDPTVNRILADFKNTGNVFGKNGQKVMDSRA